MEIANFHHTTFWVLDDGSLWASGNNSGAHGDETTESKPYAEKILNSDVVDAATGSGHSLILKSDGSLWGAGLNRDGQLGLGEIEAVTNYVKLVPSGVAAIAAAWDRSYFIKNDGSLWGMGSVRAGLSINRFYEPVQIMENSVADVAVGWRHTLILLEDGSLWGTGENFCAELGATGEYFDAPTQIIDSGVVDIAAGEKHSVILKEDGTVWTTGFCESENELGGDGGYSSFTQVISDVKSVFAGPNITMIIKNDGSVWDTNGPDDFNLVWEGDAATVVSNFDGSSFSSGLILTTDGNVLGYGYNNPDIFGSYYEGDSLDTPITITIPPDPISGAGSDILLIDYDSSGFESAFLESSDSYIIKRPPVSWLWEWPGGSSIESALSTEFPVGETPVSLTITDSYGRSSTDTLIVRVETPSTSTPNDFLSIVKAVSGIYNVYVLLNDGSLWGKGSNLLGALGDGTYTSTSKWQKLATQISRMSPCMPTVSNYKTMDLFTDRETMSGDNLEPILLRAHRPTFPFWQPEFRKWQPVQERVCY